MIHKAGFVLVLLMALLQGFYALFAFFSPEAFTQVRGTMLATSDDLDWVHIYASRTLFIALIILALLYARNYKLLMLAALMGTVMPLTDAYLAYYAEAPFGVVAKHLATVAYLSITTIVLSKMIKHENLQRA